MSYSFKFLKDSSVFGTEVQLKRDDGKWEGTPHFSSFFDHVKNLELIKNFEVYEDDVWLLGYFKTGSTLTKELVWLLNNNLDFEKAKTEILSNRFPYFEKFVWSGQTAYEQVRDTSRPRHIKTHLPAPFIPEQIWTKQPKIVHISRNPKDVAVSFYHWLKLMFPIELNLEQSLDLFLEGRLFYGSYITHNLLYWDLEKENYPNILYLTFEELIEDLNSAIEKTQKFLGKNYTTGQLNQLKDHLSFDKMKENNAVNHSEKMQDHIQDKTKFMRKGKIGSFKDEMSEEYEQKFDDWIRKALEDKDHRFKLI